MKDWVKTGTKVRCTQEWSVDGPLGRPFVIKAGQEAEILSTTPDMEYDVSLGSIVVGYFDMMGVGKDNCWAAQLRGDFESFWEPLNVAVARERPNRPMIVGFDPSRPGANPGRNRYLGYWASSSDPDADYYAQRGVLLPWPEDFIDPEWNADEKARVAAYLREASPVEQWRGFSACRICGERFLGSRDLSDGHFVWPEGFAHYIEEHSVKPVAEFIHHVHRQTSGVIAGCFG